MTFEERRDLHDRFREVCYDAILYDDLHQKLSGDEWSELAGNMAGKVFDEVRRLLDGEWERIDKEVELQRVMAETVAYENPY